MKRIIFVLLLPLMLKAQLAFFPLSADYSVFQMNDSLAYVEFYTSFFQSNLTYQDVDDTLRASFEISISVNYNGKEVNSATHKFTNTLLDSSEITRYNQFSDIFKMALPFRRYNVKITLTDLISKNNGEFLLDINVPGPQDGFYLSDLELASAIQKSASDTKFTKNNLEVIPHPRRTYDILQPMLYYYVELNNLSHEAGALNTFDVSFSVTTEEGDTIKTGPVRSKNVAAHTQAEIGAFNAMSLPVGMYYLNIHAKDNATAGTSNSRKKFYVYKPQKKTDSDLNNLPDIDPVYNTMTFDELQNEFNMARYLASNEEENIFSQMDSSAALGKFLTSFWRSRDQQNKTAFGQFRRNYLDLANLATQQYSTSMTPGWKTDRGRILLMYGRPSEIERFANTIDTKPYVIWTYYDLEGGADFIFADRTGFGQFELIHSSYHKELNNPQWYDLISNSTSTNNGFR
ncbi:MAG: GWxTD domain-containing protein [Calditrichae bacterium]|nr:GWxTD domain-containing protein [Calditrichia bacterium]